MDNKHGILVEVIEWATHRDEMHRIREEVFIKEQLVPKDLEWDDLDETATHVLASVEQGSNVGTARLLSTGQIGRMAVLKDYRGQGVGGAMLSKLIETARERQVKEIFLHAQVQAIEFYKALGFVAEGEEFLDAGIPHKLMVLR